ncbi:Cell cycle serine/threonine-protein kinase cdc5/MSD2 [Beauveria asiatica]|uniref:Cell cycle serine/threonine-protein kinase cdc5/MSD2 n=1 Tax=Beauveria asiatica TaxID=1069075 RepID=A0AAW0RKX0_9HYPO
MNSYLTTNINMSYYTNTLVTCIVCENAVFITNVDENTVIANDINGTVIAKPPAYLPNMTVDEYKLSLGRGQADQKVGKSNVVIISNKVNLVLNQWTSTEPEPPHQTRLARVGLPKTSFGPMFETLRASVTSSPGTFIYKDENGIKAKTQRLDEAIKRIIGSSSKGVATIAISLSDEATIENGRTVPIGNKYQFSVNLDNMFHFKKERVLPHSPPQSSSTGFEILEDIFSVAVRTIDHQHGLQRHRKLLHAGYGQSFWRAFSFQNSTYLVLKLCPNGSLIDRVKRRKGLTEPEVRFYSVQIAGAIKYMHRKGIIHRDWSVTVFSLDLVMASNAGGVAPTTRLSVEKHLLVLGPIS